LNTTEVRRTENVDRDALVQTWKDPDTLRDWPDDEHPSGQMYEHLSTLDGGMPNTDNDCPSWWPFGRVSYTDEP
jgi:hypothetical protein